MRATQALSMNMNQMSLQRLPIKRKKLSNQE